MSHRGHSGRATLAAIAAALLAAGLYAAAADNPSWFASFGHNSAKRV